MPSIAHLLTQTVTVKTRTGAASGYGDPTFGSATTIKARVEFKTTIYKTIDGNEKVADHVIATETPIAMGSRVWLPGADTGDDNAALEIVRVRQAQTPPGGLVLYEALA